MSPWVLCAGKYIRNCKLDTIFHHSLLPFDLDPFLSVCIAAVMVHACAPFTHPKMLVQTHNVNPWTSHRHQWRLATFIDCYWNFLSRLAYSLQQQLVLVTKPDRKEASHSYSYYPAAAVEVVKVAVFISKRCKPIYWQGIVNGSAWRNGFAETAKRNSTNATSVGNLVPQMKLWKIKDR